MAKISTTIEQAFDLPNLPENVTEIWKDIPEWEELYQASTLGRIRSKDSWVNNRHFVSLKLRKGRIRQLCPDKAGYLKVGLYKGYKGITTTVHRLVALTFLPNPENKPQVNHKNGKKWDNRVENLEWCTMAENRQHAFATGLQSQKGEKNTQAKLTLEKAVEIRERHAKGERIYLLVKEYGVSQGCITEIINNRNWKT